MRVPLCNKMSGVRIKSGLGRFLWSKSRGGYRPETERCSSFVSTGVLAFVVRGKTRSLRPRKNPKFLRVIVRRRVSGYILGCLLVRIFGCRLEIGPLISYRRYHKTVRVSVGVTGGVGGVRLRTLRWYLRNKTSSTETRG